MSNNDYWSRKILTKLLSLEYIALFVVVYVVSYIFKSRLSFVIHCLYIDLLR